MKICFIAPGAYQLLSNKKITYVTGPDLHQVLLARELVLNGFLVSIIVYCDDNSTDECINNIRILKVKTPRIQNRFYNVLIKTFYFWLSMIRADADIYYIRGGIPGIISIFSKLIRKKIVYSIASDAWVDRSIITEKVQGFSKSFTYSGVFGNLIDIKLADVVLVQTENQRKLLKNNFNKNGILIRTPFHIPKESDHKRKRTFPPSIIWVGTLTDVKKPEIFIEIAKKMPCYNFQMIGGPLQENNKYKELIREAIKLPNFEYIGVVPFDKISEYFKKADLLINTSLFEGYPHTFIQAWMYQVPVVSLNANPDQVIIRHKLGFCSHDKEQMLKDIKTILSDNILLTEMGMNGRQYVINEHDFKKITPIYIDLFYEIFESKLK